MRRLRQRHRGEGLREISLWVPDLRDRATRKALQDGMRQLWTYPGIEDDDAWSELAMELAFEERPAA
jgi:hypothetical protein